MLQLHPVIEELPRLKPLPCALAPNGRAFITLEHDPSPEDIIRVIAVLADCNLRSVRPTLGETLAALTTRGALIGSGGIKATLGDIAIFPGCCCGLEDWRSWEGLEPGSDSPWLGHDPTPWIECEQSEVRIWQDSAAEGRTPHAISAPYARLHEQVSQVEAALTGFSAAMAQWLDQIGESTEFAAHFAAVFVAKR